MHMQTVRLGEISSSEVLYILILENIHSIRARNVDVHYRCIFLIKDFVFIYKTDGFINFSFFSKLFTLMKKSLSFQSYVRSWNSYKEASSKGTSDS